MIQIQAFSTFPLNSNESSRRRNMSWKSAITFTFSKLNPTFDIKAMMETIQTNSTFDINTQILLFSSEKHEDINFQSD